MLSLTTDEKTASTTTSLATKLSDWLKQRHRQTESGYTRIPDDGSPPQYPPGAEKSVLKEDDEPGPRVVKPMKTQH